MSIIFYFRGFIRFSAKFWFYESNFVFNSFSSAGTFGIKTFPRNIFISPKLLVHQNERYFFIYYRGMVSTVAHRSPKPFVRVRILLPLPEKATCFDKSLFQWNSPFGEWNSFAMKYSDEYEIFAPQMFKRRILFHFLRQQKISQFTIVNYFIFFKRKIFH